MNKIFTLIFAVILRSFFSTFLFAAKLYHPDTGEKLISSIPIPESRLKQNFIFY